MRRWLLLVWWLPALARAEGAQGADEARRYFEAGKQAYAAEQFAAAALAFDEAYRLEPRPAILFSLAQAHRKQYFHDRDPQRLERAVELYRKYVAENPNGTRLADALQLLSTLEPLLGKGARGSSMGASATATQLLISSMTPGATASVDGGPAVKIPISLEVKPGKHQVRVEAPGHHAEEGEAIAVAGRLVVHEGTLKEMPARLSIRGADGASVSLDGRLVGTAPFARPLDLESGPKFLAVTLRGHHPLAREIELERGEELKIDADLRSTTQRKAAWWLLGGAGALALAGGTTIVLAFVAQSDAEEAWVDPVAARMNPTQAGLAAFNDAKDRRDDYVTASAILVGGAVALGVTGLILWLADNPRVEAPPGAPSIVPTVTPEGDVGVTWAIQL